MKTIRFLTNLLLFFCVSCSWQPQNEQSPEIEAIFTTENFTQGTKEELSALIVSQEFVPLEIGEAFLMGRVGDVQLYQDKIFISAVVMGDLEELFLFNRAGRFLCKIGSLGEGPQDYIRMSGFFLDTLHQRVLVLDKHAMRWNQYTFEGDFITKTPADESFKFMRSMGYAPDQKIVVLSDINFSSDVIYRLHNPDLTPEEPLATTSVTFSGATPFAARGMSTIGDSPLLLKPFNDTLFTYRQGEIVPRYINGYRNKEPFSPSPTNHDYWSLLKESRERGLNFPYTLLENRDYLILPYTDGYMMWCKKSQEGRFFAYGLTPDSRTNLFLSTITSCVGEGESFVEVLDASSFCEKARAICAQKPDKELIALLERITDDSNPVLVITHLKSAR